MHDELVKLREVSPKFTASKSSVVTSANDDDEWETVGPMNKSAVRRTQIFLPSELRNIFGGQLRSVVKSKGSKDLLLYSHISYFTLIIKEKIWLYRELSPSADKKKKGCQGWLKG
ncbi:Uncharacterized protein Rs2_23303 [Raphanus sativus]|nr:Uncharacterized protein Rs2_23303 [Raphanus sativus]